MKKTICLCLLAILVLILPFVAVAGVVLATPCQYDETFLAELEEKHARLKTVRGEKLVLIGGSNLAFGIDSAKLEEYVGMPVVNYGLYATIGTKAMLDMSRAHIGEGDIVIICPETNAQTYSLYYNAHSMWQALDCDLSMLSDVGISNGGKLLAALPAFAAEKWRFYRTDSKPSPSGIYAKSSFNEYGDIAVERPRNEMPSRYDPSMTVSLTPALLDEAFVGYLNEYADHCARRGASVYFGFTPINEDAIVSTDAEKDAFCAALSEQLSFPLLGDIDTYILDADYFYDTNFHLNSCGALQRTSLLADDVLALLGKSGETPKYDPPEQEEDKTDTTPTDTDDNARYFVFEEVTGGLAIVGLSDEGKTQKTLTVPRNADGKAVVLIGDNAFASDVLERVIIGKQAAVKGFTAEALANCPTLRALEIHLPPYELPLDAEAAKDMPTGCFVYVSAEAYSEFATDYFWSGMMQYVKILD